MEKPNSHVLSINGSSYLVQVHTIRDRQRACTQLTLTGWLYRHCPPRSVYSITVLIPDDLIYESGPKLRSIVEDTKISLFRALTTSQGSKFDVYEIQECSSIIGA